MPRRMHATPADAFAPLLDELRAGTVPNSGEWLGRLVSVIRPARGAGWEAVLYFTDLEKNLHVCAKCGFHNRLSSRQRLDAFRDAEDRAELASEVVPLDPLKFKDSRKYTERLAEAEKETGETDALVVMQGAVKSVPLVAAAFEFEFLGGSMGSAVGERFVRGGQACCDERLPFVCFTATGGARMQEGLYSLMQMAKTTAALHQLSAARQPFVSVLTGPHHGRRLGELRHDRRRGHRRARRPGRICRSARHRADGARDASGGLPASRVPVQATVGWRVPENALLSHDLFEGLYARTALVSDVELVDDYPVNVLAHARRQHRWVRGDWQILAWIFPLVPTPLGFARNRLPLISRWKIIDNLRRSLVAPALLAFFAAAWTFLPGSPVAWTVGGLTVVAFPFVASLFQFLRRRPAHEPARVHLRGLAEEQSTSLAQALLTLVFLPAIAGTEDGFHGFLTMFLVLFLAAGIGNAAVFSLIPRVFAVLHDRGKSAAGEPREAPAASREAGPVLAP